MWEFRNVSIKNKLTIIIMMICSIVLVLSSAAFIATALITIRKSMADKLLTISNVIGESSAAALTSNDEDTAGKILASLSAEPNVLSAFLYNTDFHGK